MATSDETMIAALRRERDMYDRQGKEDRVAQVDDQLHRLGYTGEQDQGEDEPTGRTAHDPGQQTATAPPAPGAAATNGNDTTVSAPPAPAAEAAPAKAPAKKAAAARAKPTAE